MLKRLKKLIPIWGLVLLFLTNSYRSFSQEAYTNMMDTATKGLFKNFIGIKLFAADFGATGVNRDLQFQYITTNYGYMYEFQHDMNVTGLSNFINLGLGLEENLGKHLSIDFFNTSLGYMQHMWDWNVCAGAGYFISLNKEQTMRLNASLKVNFESITYSFGNYYDTTQLGFLVNGVDVGVSLNNVKYVNIIWTLSPGIEFLYRRRKLDYFAGIYYNYVFAYHEKVNFYRASVPVSGAIYYSNGEAVSGDVVNLNNYIIEIGIMYEFGL